MKSPRRLSVQHVKLCTLTLTLALPVVGCGSDVSNTGDASKDGGTPVEGDSTSHDGGVDRGESKGGASKGGASAGGASKGGASAGGESAGGSSSEGKGGSATAGSSAGGASAGESMLGTADGISGTFKGVTYAFTMSPLHIPQQTPTVLISASGHTDTWSIRMIPMLGTQKCNGSAEAGDPAVSFRSLSNLDFNGTTGTDGACSITITSLAPKYEGTFTATILSIGAGELEVTEGAFRVAN
ncbi:MAG: hypothetical protein RJA70_2354 [Pseudomonadota bacterium]|jgi:hypothetical protein